jgi:hypothetical protein
MNSNPEVKLAGCRSESLYQSEVRTGGRVAGGYTGDGVHIFSSIPFDASVGEN